MNGDNVIVKCQRNAFQTFDLSMKEYKKKTEKKNSKR